MTDYLKAKLVTILKDEALGNYTKDPDGNFVPLNWERTPDSYFEDAISQIDTAYKDAGYIYPPPTYHEVKRVLASERIADAELKTINQAYRQYGLMTGQEWYDRFTKEIGSWGTGAYSGDLNSVLEAAKKTAGLEE